MATIGLWGRSLALVFLGVLLLSEPAWACTCVSVFSPETVKRAAAVFIGKATTVEFLEPDERAKEPPILVTFDVSEIWKGPERKMLRLRTTYNKWTCAGYSFKEGETYIVAAFKIGSGQGGAEVELGGVNICGGTRELDQAQDMLRVLGPGKKPADEGAKRLPSDMLGVVTPSNYTFDPTDDSLALGLGPWPAGQHKCWADDPGGQQLSCAQWGALLTIEGNTRCRRL